MRPAQQAMAQERKQDRDLATFLATLDEMQKALFAAAIRDVIESKSSVSAMKAHVTCRRPPCR
jgi:hypothetical protein